MTDTTEPEPDSGIDPAARPPLTLQLAAWTAALALVALAVVAVLGHLHDRDEADALAEHRVAILHSQAAILQAQVDANDDAAEHHRALEAWACAQTIVAAGDGAPDEGTLDEIVGEAGPAEPGVAGVWWAATLCDTWVRPLAGERAGAGDLPPLRSDS